MTLLETQGGAPDWWRGAVIYQIYPRSFADSNNDGIGDLAGIVDKMDYIADLGVDAIWISPFFTSPMKDFGYDVADYRGVDPIFGDLADFDAVIAAAHARDLRVLIDQVLSHSSDAHPWFVQSRADRTNARADWYVWAEAKADGNPPTNWLSVFGGPAWQWDTRRCQYYLHNFLASQPDLNIANPDVAAAMLDEMAFWLDRGVDGVRLDAVHCCIHGQLADNPPKPAGSGAFMGARADNPYDFQAHVHDHTQAANVDWLKQIRARLDQYPGATSVGEVGGDDALGTMAEYTAGGDRLHMCYSFGLLTERADPAHLVDILAEMEARIGDGWPCWSVGNHDVTRVASRWAAEGDVSRQRLILAFLLTQRGSVCLYQGEELGLPEAELAFEDIVDPAGLEFWPAYKGRDGCRTPMPWQADAPNAGFSDAAPWLPVPEAHEERAVDRQQADPQSLLNATRDLLAWRKAQPALIDGGIRYAPVAHDVVCLTRSHAGQTLAVMLNFSDQPRRVVLPGGAGALDKTPGWFDAAPGGDTVQLGPHGVAAVACTREAAERWQPVPAQPEETV